MENTEKSFGQQVKEGYERGVRLAGGKEDASQARIITSPEPLPNEVKKMRKGYLVCLACLLIGIIWQPLLILGLLGLLIFYLFMDAYARHKRKQLRIKKFKFVEGIDDATLFEVIQPIFISKYGMQVEKRKDGVVMITHEKCIYDILLEEDNTFCIWWRLSVGRALFSFSDDKIYRKNLAAMGIIAYEIQRAFGINEKAEE